MKNPVLLYFWAMAKGVTVNYHLFGFAVPGIYWTCGKLSGGPHPTRTAARKAAYEALRTR